MPPDDKRSDAGSATVRGMVDEVAGRPKPDSSFGEEGKPDPRAAALAQGGVPNIAVAKAIEAVKKDAVVVAPSIAPTETGSSANPIGSVSPPVMVRAAGILFVTKSNQALFIKRTAAADHAGEWCFPGGVVEGEETSEQAARRETNEEVGWSGDDPIQPWTRRSSAGASVDGAKVVDFTTFLLRIDEPFVPTLNDEHVGYAWAPVDAPPEPLHPGCRVALSKIGMDELGLARAMASGELTSPQHFKNFWLFDMRITGTGVAYRSALNEFVYRRPEHYLTDDYLTRCNGLPVIMMHPKKATLDSKEFNDRVVGGMMLPYIKENEVWGIARIYDDAAADMMLKNKLSTSPSVILRTTDNAKMKLEDGSTLLIEGKPALMDHLAICENGVWDKGEGPSGIRSENITEELAMADDDKKAEDKKADETKTEKVADKKADAGADEKKGEEKKGDADAGTQLDQVLAKMDAHKADTDDKFKKMDARMDSVEGKKADATKKKDGDGDPEEVAADKKRKDADDDKDKDEKKEKAEDKKADATEIAARGDATVALTKRIDDLQRMIPKSMTDSEYHAMADAQARADNVFIALGQRAPRPLDGENLAGYRRRLAKDLKPHTRWKDVPVEAMADENAFKVAEEQIYADAQIAAANPVDLPAGQIRGVTKPDSTGRQITSFYGQPKTWMGAFGGSPMRLLKINNGSDRR